MAKRKGRLTGILKNRSHTGGNNRYLTPMKPIVVLLLFFVGLRAVSQPHNTAHIRLRTGQCQPTPYTWPTLPDSIQFFLLPADELVTTVMPGRQRHWPIEIDVPKGNYRLVYPNIFGQQMTKQCSLYEDSLVELIVCPDSLTAYPENTLAKLKENDTLTIAVFTVACMRDTRKKIVLTRQKGGIEAMLYEDKREAYLKGKSTRYRERKNVLIGEKNLTPADMLHFVSFENELRMIKPGRCTTTDHYTISSKYWNFRIDDGSCKWAGFYMLIEAWFGPSWKDAADAEAASSRKQ
jgi:hypothetical protein